MVAGYCWEWIKAGKENTNVHDINLPDYDFSMSWNLGNTNTWAIDEESVQEVGCIHTCQGLEFDYVGVIIGMDMIYRDGKVITDYTKRAKTDKSLNGLLGKCKKRENEALALADKIIRNTYRTLMTRGQKGCYVFCEDIELGKYLKERMQINKVQYGEMKTIGLIAEGVENYHI